MSKPNFSPEIREMALMASNGYCQVEGCTNTAEDLHHLLSNSKVNNQLFPLFTQSIFNCFPICRKCHVSPPKISERWARVYEVALEKMRRVF